MHPEEQQAWQKLGWTAEMWAADTESVYPTYTEKGWNELSAVEQRALLELGFTAQSWGSFNTTNC
jgi:hypothetical protein